MNESVVGDVLEYSSRPICLYFASRGAFQELCYTLFHPPAGRWRAEAVIAVA